MPTMRWRCLNKCGMPVGREVRSARASTIEWLSRFGDSHGCLAPYATLPSGESRSLGSGEGLFRFGVVQGKRIAARALPSPRLDPPRGRVALVWHCKQLKLTCKNYSSRLRSRPLLVPVGLRLELVCGPQQNGFIKPTRLKLQANRQSRGIESAGNRNRRHTR